MNYSGLKIGILIKISNHEALLFLAKTVQTNAGALWCALPVHGHHGITPLGNNPVSSGRLHRPSPRPDVDCPKMIL